ncbi:MAG: hypothetical protein JWM36_4830 [Hyphomicrobiales bacterium]|nr:hypothetical protein [Hyphomicrobiales bacterium]
MNDSHCSPYHGIPRLEKSEPTGDEAAPDNEKCRFFRTSVEPLRFDGIYGAASTFLWGEKNVVNLAAQLARSQDDVAILLWIERNAVVTSIREQGQVFLGRGIRNCPELAVAYL